MGADVASFAQLVDLQVGAATHRGKRRRVNEDSLLAVPHVYVVADGMGGHSAGDLASAIAVEEMRALAALNAEPADVDRVLDQANHRVRALGEAGTTVTGVLGVSRDNVPYWLVVNLGDSRVYRLASQRLAQVSVDHSVVQELVDAGELAPADVERHPQRHVVTRAVGAPVALEADYWLLPAVPGERLLLCSDGLTVEVGEDALRDALVEHDDPQAAADSLIELALEGGGRDNITVVVVDVQAVRAAVDESATLARSRTKPDIDDTQPRMSAGVL